MTSDFIRGKKEKREHFWKCVVMMMMMMMMMMMVVVVMMMMIIIIIIKIFINCYWVVTRWQWLFYMNTNMKKKSN